MPTPYVHDPEIHRTKDAERIVPIIMKLFSPASVLDIGCGTGAFLKVFNEQGVKEIQGIEGDWLDESKLFVPKDRILITDIEQGFNLNRKFDIALCLEVAEHIHEPQARQLISALTAHSDVIVFSAAVPYQGGQNHVNEQWIGYWQSMFASQNYKMYDLIRPLIWDEKDIFWWYRQNIVVCLNSAIEHRFREQPIHNYIHPELYVSKVAELRAYQQWIDKIFSGQVELEVAEAILNRTRKFHSNKG